MGGGNDDTQIDSFCARSLSANVNASINPRGECLEIAILSRFSFARLEFVGFGANRNRSTSFAILRIARKMRNEKFNRFQSGF